MRLGSRPVQVGSLGPRRILFSRIAGGGPERTGPIPVVDASVVIDVISPETDPRSPAVVTIRRMLASGEELLAPPLLRLETANALLTGVRRGRWSGGEADQAHGRFRRLPIRLVDDQRDVVRAWELARRHDNHAIYDMVYVALAERARMPLVTADARLRRAFAQVGPWAAVAPEDLP